MLLFWGGGGNPYITTLIIAVFSNILIHRTSSPGDRYNLKMTVTIHPS